MIRKAKFIEFTNVGCGFAGDQPPHPVVLAVDSIESVQKCGDNAIISVKGKSVYHSFFCLLTYEQAIALIKKHADIVS